MNRLQEKLAEIITEASFTMTFVWVHVIVFSAWIITKGLGHDAFPFNFLTMAVSLEAIFLSTFVGISERKHAHKTHESLKHSLKEHISKEINK